MGQAMLSLTSLRGSETGGRAFSAPQMRKAKLGELRSLAPSTPPGVGRACILNVRVAQEPAVLSSRLTSPIATQTGTLATEEASVEN